MNGKPAPGSRTGIPMRVEYAKKKSDNKSAGGMARVQMPKPVLGPYGYAMPSFPGAQQGERLMQRNVYVAQLPPEYTKEQLQALFSPYGTVTECNILKDMATGQGRGVGFVHYTSREEAANAISKMNGYQLPGHVKPLRCKFARDTKGTNGSKPAYPGANWNAYGQASGYGGYGYGSAGYGQTYPQQSATYPPTATYPPSNTTYPPATAASYPPPTQSYPPTNPSYPPTSSTALSYPPGQATGYPPSGYAAPSYPPAGAPSGNYGSYGQQQQYPPQPAPRGYP